MPLFRQAPTVQPVQFKSDTPLRVRVSVHAAERMWQVRKRSATHSVLCETQAIDPRHHLLTGINHLLS